jgi:hypothetical protein
LPVTFAHVVKDRQKQTAASHSLATVLLTCSIACPATTSPMLISTDDSPGWAASAHTLIATVVLRC